MHKPNILLITIDECKASAMPPYGNGYTIGNTSVKMAENGAVFENAFTCHPKCVPSRCCLLSGRYAHTNGHRTLPGFELDHTEPNLALILKEHGYKTAMFGKNHTVTEEFKPACFDVVTTDFSRQKMKKDVPQHDTQSGMFRAFYRGKWEDTYETEHIDFYDIEDGLEFMKSNKDNPFFMLMNLTQPHPVYYEMQPYFDIISKMDIPVPPRHSLENAPETLKGYRKAYELEELTDQQLLTIVKAYYSMVSYIDDKVARLYEQIDELGLTENTIIIYTSDHGDFAGEHGCAEKYDTLFYDCIMKIPLFMQYPPLISKGTRFDSLTENVDIAPTLLEMVGIPVPENMHGKSLLNYIKGATDQHKTHVFCEGGVEQYAIDRAPHYDSPLCQRMRPTYYRKQKALIDHATSMQRSKVIRSKEWKFIYRQNGETELYNLISDPDEMTNLTDDKQFLDVKFDLMQKLMEWLIRTEPDYPRIENLYA